MDESDNPETSIVLLKELEYLIGRMRKILDIVEAREPPVFTAEERYEYIYLCEKCEKFSTKAIQNAKGLNLVIPINQKREKQNDKNRSIRAERGRMV